MYLGNPGVKLKSNPTANVSDPVLLISRKKISELELVLVF